MNSTSYFLSFWKNIIPGSRKGFMASFFILLFLLFSNDGVCQPGVSPENFKFIRLTEQIGLKNRAFLDIFQDSKGFIWFGADYGVFRFDGYEYKSYYTMPGDTSSISSNGVSLRAFQEDANQDIWVATLQGGLNKFDRKQEKFQRINSSMGIPLSLIPNRISAIQNDKKNGLWIASHDKGLLHFDPKNPPYLNRVYPSGQAIDSISGSPTTSCIWQSPMGQLWLGTFKGLIIYGLKGKQFFHFPPGQGPNNLSGNFVTDIYQDKSGRIWVATNEGLNRWEAETHSFTRYFPASILEIGDPNYNYIWKIFEDSQGNYWVGTNAGLLRFRVENGQFERINYRPADPFSISEGAVHAIMEDRSGNVWFGTDTGVSLLNPSARRFNREEFEPIQSSLPAIASNQGIVALLEVKGRLWLATQKGLFIYKTGQAPKLVLPGDFSALFKDSQDRIYAGTIGNGFYILDADGAAVLAHFEKESQNPYSPQRPTGHRIYDFAEDQQGYIWIAANGCLNHYNPSKMEFRHYYSKDTIPNSLSNSNIKALKLDSRGDLWIGTQNGLNLLSQAELSRQFEASRNFVRFKHEPDNPNSISNDRVSTIVEDAQGKLWIGTEAGLNSFTTGKEKWQRFFTTDGLPDNRIAAILEDNEGMLWIATARSALSKYDASAHRFFNYSLKDGLNSELSNENACLKTAAGLLVFANQNGLNAFDPAEIVPTFQQFPLYITDFELYNKAVPIGGKDAILQQTVYLTRKISLPFRQKVFSFKVAALNFLNPEKQCYRYKLEDFDKDWRFLGNSREMTFTNLFPGNYNLIIESTDTPDNWACPKSQTSLQISIRPPWWLSWWAFLLYAILITGGINGLLRFRVRQAKQQAENERLRSLDEVKNRMYAYIVHQFRDPLAIIFGLAEQFWGNVSNGMEKNLRIIQENGQYLSSLVDQILDLSNLKSGATPVKMVQGDIILFLKYIFESFQSYAETKGITMVCETALSQYVMDYDPDKLRKIISNLLSNALKFSNEKDRVMLLAREVKSKDTTQLEITISDTGIGIPEDQLDQIFEPFRQADNKLTRQGIGSGIGLTLAKELLTLLEGSIRVQSQHGKGAKFIVTLPVRHNAPLADAMDKSSIVNAVKRGIGMWGGKASKKAKVLKPHPKTGDKPLLLLIEDNPNVRAYLSQHLKKEYQLLTAEDGALGLTLAQEQLPDIIISDVTMPGKDGYELCREIRKELSTSHIPVVLLTARADVDSRIQGLTAGADDFLSKPVNLNELSVRLKNLLQLRQILQDRYRSPEFWKGKAGAPSPAPEDRRVSAEDAFLKKLQAIIEANISDPELDIKKLQKQAGMSSSNIHRKLKALTGMHTTEFVRYIRLTRASELLCENPHTNVSEIYSEVGFNSHSYFSKKFKEVFGCSPKVYQEERCGLKTN